MDLLAMLVELPLQRFHRRGGVPGESRSSNRKVFAAIGALAVQPRFVVLGDLKMWLFHASSMAQSAFQFQTAKIQPVPLSLRQQITDAVVATSLDVDSVAAEIDYEREQTVELRSLWRYKRDRAIGSTNLAVLAAGTGLGIVSGLLQFSETTSSAGNAVGFAAGGISTLFSLRSFRQVHSGRRPAWVLPNMLAAYLGHPEEQHSHYPEDIWAYLTSVPPGVASQASRTEQMLAGWVAAGRIGPRDSPQWKRKIALLTSTNAADKDLNIELMNERAAMLADVADQVLLMKHDLADLLRALRP